MFEWDAAKNAANLAKHGIDFAMAQRLWEDVDRLETPSPVASGEERWLVTGRIDDLLWSAIVTYRGGNIRIISVRRARSEEREDYLR
jgi:uncharacterized DUF497 family protein